MDQFHDNNFGTCKILYRNPGKLENVCLFASHTFSDYLPEYVYYYLESIKKAGLSLIFISSSPLCQPDVTRLMELANIIIEKENKGTDFGAWCATLRQMNYGKDFQTLYLCNDSVFGPLFPLSGVHEKFCGSEKDIIGITDSHQGAGYHIQSYFVGVKKNVLVSSVWEKFWSEMEYHKDKQKVIEFYEVGLTQRLLKAGFSFHIWTDWFNKFGYSEILKKVSKSNELRPRWLNRVLYEQEDIVFDINPSSFLWRELIESCNSVFIKRELFIFKNLFTEFELENNWKAVLEKNSDYPIWVIKLFLVNHFFFKSVKNGLHEITGFNMALVKPESEANSVLSGNTEVLLFGVLKSILTRVETPMTLPLQFGLGQLESINISYLPVTISSSKPPQSIICTLIYLNYKLATFDSITLGRLKTALKRITNPLIVVPDSGSKAIVASLLSIRQEGLILENDFLFQAENCKVTEYFRSLLIGGGKNQRSLFQRPTLADVAKDVIHSVNTSDFISVIESRLAPEEVDYDSNFYVSRSDYLQYLAIKEKYSDLYESTPLWYKKMGQVIKLVTLKKQLSVQWKDKGLKDVYKPTAQDLLHWYHVQYEVLPRWFKEIGKSLVKKKVRE